LNSPESSPSRIRRLPIFVAIASSLSVSGGHEAARGHRIEPRPDFFAGERAGIEPGAELGECSDLRLAEIARRQARRIIGCQQRQIPRSLGLSFKPTLLRLNDRDKGFDALIPELRGRQAGLDPPPEQRQGVGFFASFGGGAFPASPGAGSAEAADAPK
jgi:hypothetical protein